MLLQYVRAEPWEPGYLVARSLSACCNIVNRIDDAFPGIYTVAVLQIGTVLGLN